MKSEKLLSIVIPIFNKEAYIKKCLKSIIYQLNKEIELLLIDDCSIDNTQTICKEFLNENIQYIKFRKNSGVSAARNKGIKKSTGKYIWFIDADDFLTQKSINEILKYLKDEKLDVLTFEINRIKQGKIVGKYIPRNSENKYDILDNSPCNKIYKKEILKNNNLYFDEKLMMGEDKYFNLCVANHTNIDRIKIINKAYYNYVEGIGVTSNLTNTIKILETFQKIFETFNEEPLVKKALEKNYNEWLRIIVASILKNNHINLKFKIKQLKFMYQNLNEAFYFFKKSYKFNFFYEIVRRLIIIIFQLDKIKRGN